MSHTVYLIICTIPMVLIGVALLNADEKIKKLERKVSYLEQRLNEKEEEEDEDE